jgi:hypothetical protein
MFPSKLKVAAGLAAGALTLGTSSSSAVANANKPVKTVTVSPTPITLGSGSHQLKLIGFNGTTSLTLPAGGFKSKGECVSFLAKNKNIALAPQGSTTGSVTLPKHYHSKLVRAARVWCIAQLNSTASHGHRRGHGHARADGKHASS